ncbi:hypothetical protein [Rhabdonatronobacter sediminivivens]|nr:hypothetical protein [Rhabdonatronobacter sediminivivens]
MSVTGSASATGFQRSDKKKRRAACRRAAWAMRACQQMACGGQVQHCDAQGNACARCVRCQSHDLRQGANRTILGHALRAILRDAKILQFAAHLDIGGQHRIGRQGGGMLMTKPDNHQRQRKKRSGQTIRKGPEQSHVMVLLWVHLWIKHL